MARIRVTDFKIEAIVCVIKVWILLLSVGALSQELQSSPITDPELQSSPITDPELQSSPIKDPMLCPDERLYSFRALSCYGPRDFRYISPCCEKQRQSPRNLVSQSSSSLCNRKFKYFRYSSKKKITGETVNNGHVPNVNFDKNNTIYLHNAPYTRRSYYLENIHLHYCVDQPRNGSEHTINNKYYFGELHLLHVREGYTLQQAFMKPDGVVIIALMVQVKDSNQDLNPEMVRLVNAWGDTLGTASSGVAKLSVRKLFPKSRDFFTYQGSMTSYPCSENARWIIMREPVNISTREMEILGNIPNLKGGTLGRNCESLALQKGTTKVETNFFCSPYF